MTRSFFYWPTSCRNRTASTSRWPRGSPTSWTAHRGRPDHDPDLPDRAHVRRELDPAWRNGRHLYSDVWLVGRQAWFAGRWCAASARTGGMRRLVSNEMPLYGGQDTPHEVVAAWAQSSGTGPRGRRPPAVLARRRRLGIENSGVDNGSGSPTSRRCATSSARTAIPCRTTRSGSTTRPRGSASWPGRSAGPSCWRNSGPARTTSPGERGALLPPVLANACCRRHRLDRLEQHGLRRAAPGSVPAPRLRAAFRLTGADGHPKPQLDEMKSFAGHSAPSTPRTAGARPPAPPSSCRPTWARVPFTDPAWAVPGADARPGLRVGPAGRPAGRAGPGKRGHRRRRPPLLLPSLKQLLATTPGRWKARRGGACVYFSYSAGTSAWHRGPSYDGLETAFGVRHQLTYGWSTPSKTAR